MQLKFRASYSKACHLEGNKFQNSNCKASIKSSRKIDWDLLGRKWRLLLVVFYFLSKKE